MLVVAAAMAVDKVVMDGGQGRSNKPKVVSKVVSSILFEGNLSR